MAFVQRFWSFHPAIVAQPPLTCQYHCEGWVNLEDQKTRLQVMTVPIDHDLVEKMEIRCLQLMVEVYQLASRANRERRHAGVSRRINTSNLPDDGAIPMRAAPHGFDSLCQAPIH